MSLISQTYSATSGQIASSAGFNSDLSALFGAINGNLDSANINPNRGINASLINAGAFPNGAFSFPGSLSVGSITGALSVSAPITSSQPDASGNSFLAAGANGAYTANFHLGSYGTTGALNGINATCFGIYATSPGQFVFSLDSSGNVATRGGVSCTSLNTEGGGIVSGAISCGNITTNGSSITAGSIGASSVTTGSISSGNISGTSISSQGGLSWNNGSGTWGTNGTSNALFVGAGQTGGGYISNAGNSVAIILWDNAGNVTADSFHCGASSLSPSQLYVNGNCYSTTGLFANPGGGSIALAPANNAGLATTIDPSGNMNVVGGISSGPINSNSQIVAANNFQTHGGGDAVGAGVVYLNSSNNRYIAWSGLTSTYQMPSAYLIVDGYTVPSSRRLKHQIANIELDSIEAIKKLKVVSFKYHPDVDKGGCSMGDADVNQETHHGIIAEESPDEFLLPVRDDAKGFSLHSSLAIALDAIKKLTFRIESLESEISELRKAA